MRHFCFFLTLFLFPLHLAASIRIGILSDSGYVGEREIGWRIKKAAEAIGWEVILDETKGKAIYKRKDLDWIICLLSNQEKYINPHCPNYLTIFHPFHFLDNNYHLLPRYAKYDGYLLTIESSRSFKESGLLNNKRLFYTKFYPSLAATEYKRVPLHNLVTMLPAWGNRLFDRKYQELYTRLSLGGFTEFYGLSSSPEIIPQGYKGIVPFDGTSVIDVLQRHGIVLLLHSDIHNLHKIPSGRIFEAAAASAVIISDKNEFVQKHFDDSVFYIDSTGSAEEIYQQIETHMQTIQTNPDLAWRMAEKAHQIFVENFSMTYQLLELEKMDQKVKLYKKK